MRKFLSLVLSVILVVFLGVLFSVDILRIKLQEKPDFVLASFCSTMDEEPPQIILSGGELSIVKLGQEFNDAGASAIDDCGISEFDVYGEVDTNNVGSYEIKYVAKDTSGNTTEMVRTVGVISDIRGKIYLTFDDGPGQHTAVLLDILKKYNVPATFFVTGAGDDEIILREYNEGHAIGLHTYTHNYSYIYRSIDAFMSDVYRIQERVKNITGYTSYLLRFPGGSSNTVSKKYDGGSKIMTKLANEVVKLGFTYFDWNITSGDAGDTTSTTQIIENVTSKLHSGGNFIVLQHDVKDYSVAAVESIIKYGLSNGYIFDKLSINSFTAHHRINN